MASQPNPAVTAAVGLVATVSAKTITTPVERVACLYQCHGELLKNGRLPIGYSGYGNVISHIYWEEGITHLSFFRGNVINCIEAVSRKVMGFVMKDLLRAGIPRPSGDNIGAKLGYNMATGAGAGFLTLASVYHMDYCKIRLYNDVIGVGQQKMPQQFTGIIDVYRKTWASDGIRGLYRGFFVSVLGIAVYRGMYFGLYDTFRPYFKLTREGNILASFFLGYAVTIASGLIAYPFDTIRRRMLMRSGEETKYKGFIDCGRYIIRYEGFMALMRGSALQVVFFSACGATLLVTYDKIMALFRR